MEYEIAEEGELLDASNNPSLGRCDTAPATSEWTIGPNGSPGAARALQKAELIPGEPAPA